MQQRQTPAPPPEGRPLLEVRDLRVSFFTPAGEVRAVSGISYQVDYGEVVGIVGESGSGKSVEAYSIMGLLQPPGRVVGGSRGRMSSPSPGGSSPPSGAAGRP